MSIEKIKEGFKTYMEKQKAAREEKKQEMKYEKTANKLIQKKAKAEYFRAKETEEKTYAIEKAKLERENKLRKYKERTKRFSSGMGTMFSPSRNLSSQKPKVVKTKKKHRKQHTPQPRYTVIGGKAYQVASPGKRTKKGRKKRRMKRRMKKEKPKSNSIFGGLY